MPVSSEDYRDALRHFPSGVTIVTIKAGEEVHGLTVSAFASVSPDPPLIGVMIDHRHHAYPLLEEEGAVAIYHDPFVDSLTEDGHRWENQELTVSFDGRPIAYRFADLDQLVLAYAITIHKSQGSEFPVVVIPISSQHYIMLRRNLVYTGLTRGKKLVVLVGERKALAMAVKNDDSHQRWSGLGQRLVAGGEGNEVDEGAGAGE